jgi:hypothetical protein
MISAKPVIPDRYWILRDHDQKIGNIQADDSGYAVVIHGNTRRFTDIPMIAKTFGVDFENISVTTDGEPKSSVHGYPTAALAYNALWDVKRQIPLWTTEPRSKSWRAAGWYRVKQHRSWRLVFCPKLILLDRYQYQGPYVSREQARSV